MKMAEAPIDQKRTEKAPENNSVTTDTIQQKGKIGIFWNG